MIKIIAEKSSTRLEFDTETQTFWIRTQANGRERRLFAGVEEADARRGFKWYTNER